MTTGPLSEIVIEVEVRPPKKSEAKSLLAAGHPKSCAVMALLERVRNSKSKAAMDASPPRWSMLMRAGLFTCRTLATPPRQLVASPKSRSPGARSVISNPKGFENGSATLERETPPDENSRT